MYIEAINSIHDSATSTRSIKVVVNTTYNETANLALAATSSSAASDHIDWIGLFTSIGVVVVAIGCGLMVSTYKPEHRTRCNAVGNASGASLIIFSFVFSSSEGDPIWDRSRSFYLVVGLPCVLGIISAAAISSLPCFGLSGPEKSSVCIECCYQNVALAQAVAINMYEGKEAGIAVGVPVFYGLVEIVTIGIFCLTSWKAGVTYAPANDPLWKVVTHSYQHLAQPKQNEVMPVVTPGPKLEAGLGKPAAPTPSPTAPQGQGDFPTKSPSDPRRGEQISYCPTQPKAQ
mmetsp:Transcript_7730/g.16256  ORF Transcript_7730/g.16256 Transcript_7730/m.16256 type:complete len:288 (-) Transcript_7730:178-1041(-)